jgi:outer membrane lipopolysaccharide assembly protein LptE/RlpB
MAKILKNCICVPMIFIIAICGLHAKGQLSVTGKLRTRTDFRDGSGTLTLKINSH